LQRLRCPWHVLPWHCATNHFDAYDHPSAEIVPVHTIQRTSDRRDLVNVATVRHARSLAVKKQRHWMFLHGEGRLIERSIDTECAAPPCKIGFPHSDRRTEQIELYVSRFDVEDESWERDFPLGILGVWLSIKRPLFGGLA